MFKDHVIFYIFFMSSNYSNTVMKDLPLVASNHYKPKKRTRITRDTSSIPMIFSPKTYPTASSHFLLLETINEKTTGLGKLSRLLIHERYKHRKVLGEARGTWCMLGKSLDF